MSHKAFLLTLVLLVSACVTIDPQVPPEADRGTTTIDPSDQATEPAYPDEYPTGDNEVREPDDRVAIATPESVNRLPGDVARSASANLRSQASSAVSEGDNEKAIRLLERALRIAPREAQTYYDFANVRLSQQRPQDALQLARRGLSMQPDLALRNDLEQLVQISSTRSNP